MQNIRGKLNVSSESHITLFKQKAPGFCKGTLRNT